jgi:glutathione S-transferase
MLTLYGLPVSTYTTKVRIALHAKGIAFKEEPPPGGYRSEAWRAVVPTGTIPAIDHDGFLLAESEAIIEYLDEAFPGPSLFPGNAQARALARRLARIHDLHVEPAVRALFGLIRDPAERERLPELAATLDLRLAQWLATSPPAPWAAGEHFSAADCGFAVTVPLAHRLLEALGRPLEMPEALREWLKQCESHTAIRSGLAPWRPATEAWLAQAMGGQT